jgi:hypothetical protein
VNTKSTALLLVMLAVAPVHADTQIAQLRLSVDTKPILNHPNDGSADRVIFRDREARVTLTLTVAAMPSTAPEKLTGLRLNDDWTSSVKWNLTTDDGTPVRHLQPIFVQELRKPRRRGGLAAGEQISAAFRLPLLAAGTYRLIARIGSVESEFTRFVVSDGAESVPLRTTYAWVQAQHARDRATREKWLQQLGELDPTMPAPWVELGDNALSREDFGAAREYYNHAVRAFGARRVRFANQGSPELIREIDAKHTLFTKIIGALDSTAANGSRLIVRVQHNGGKHYVVAERTSGRIVDTIQAQ